MELVHNRKYKIGKKNLIRPDIQANFWNGDPDIDAVCRMEHAPECKFDNSFFPFSSNKFSPFNSQNTFISKKVLPHYFLFPHIGSATVDTRNAMGFRALDNIDAYFNNDEPKDKLV